MKVHLTLVAFVCIAGLSSCMKNYNCQCFYYDSSNGESMTETYRTNASSKENADKQCESRNDTTGVYSVDCEII